MKASALRVFEGITDSSAQEWQHCWWSLNGADLRQYAINYADACVLDRPFTASDAVAVERALVEYRSSNEMWVA